MRVCQCPIARWPGEVVIREPLGWPEYLAWQRAVQAGADVIELAGTQADYDAAIAPGLMAVVSEWRLTGCGAPSADGIPATPRKDSAAFVAWLIGEVTRVVLGEDTPDPKASAQ